MKHRWLILALLLGVFGACSEPGDEARTGNASPAGSAAVEPARGATGTATSAAETEVVYVDVRTPEEYAAGHVEGAINIPHTEMQERYAELEPYRGEEIVVYCRSGRRSGIAKGILDGVGFENVVNGGGLQDLQARGVPTTR